jgi:acyl-CoA synthetase (AMP-forming)/AMP-acid ligase II
VLGAEQLIFGRLVDRWAEHGDSPAIVADGRAVSYSALVERADRLANALIGLGVVAGERIAFAYGNGAEIVGCYLACARSGIVGMPLAERLTEDEALFQLADSGVSAVICPAAWAERMLRRRAELPALRIVITDEPGGPDGLVRSELEDAASPLAPAADLRPTDPFCLMYTGGTTGASKAALQTQASWAACVDDVVHMWRLEPQDRHVIVLPMTHVAWFSCAAHLHAGARVTVPEGRWDPPAVLRMVGEQGITTLNMIPTMLGDLLAALERFPAPPDLRTLRQLTVAGSSVPLEMFRRAQRALGLVLGNIYGMTESSGPATYLLPEHMTEDLILSGGRTGPHVELAILDEEDRPLTSPQTGEIGLRGPQITAGYLNRDEESAAALANGWFHTGDVGYLDADGFVYVVDRKKDMIKSGGFNVYPKEVEEVLYRHPDVIEAAVIGLPDERWIEAVNAVVVLRTDSALSQQDLIEHCRAHLTGHKVPKAVYLVSGLPRTSVGKFDKRELRRRYLPEPATAA